MITDTECTATSQFPDDAEPRCLLVQRQAEREVIALRLGAEVTLPASTSIRYEKQYEEKEG